MNTIRTSIVCILALLGILGKAQRPSSESKVNNSLIFGPCNNPDRVPCDTRRGTIILGAFFPMHEWDYTSNNCSVDFRSESGFQRMEAFRWAAEKYGGTLSGFEVNNTIGYDIRDSCSKDTNTRDEALEFINVGTNCQEAFRDRPISLVVGASSSSVSIDLTNLQSLFDVPQISYASTTDKLNDSTRFNMFVRVVPPDVYQVRAMVSLLEHYNWSYVSVVYSGDQYGESAFERIREESETFVGRDGKFRFCLAARQKIDPSAGREKYREVLNDLILNSDDSGWHYRAKVVIVFAQARTATLLLKEAMQSPNRSMFEDLTWIASDAWSRSVFAVKDSFPVARGLLSVEPYADESDADTVEFNDRLRKMMLNNFAKHEWYKEFFRQLFPDRNCTDFTTDSCSHYKIEDSMLYAPDRKIPFVIQSTRVAIQAITGALRSLCNRTENLILCEAAHTTRNTNRAVKGLDKALTNATIAAAANLGLKLVEDSRAYLRESMPYKYSIFKLLLKNGKKLTDSVTSSDVPFQYNWIGSWSTTGNISDGQLTIIADTEFTDGVSSVPTSICALECEPGKYQKAPTFANTMSATCCWSCEQCPQFEYASNSSVTTCQKCPSTQTHNSDQTGCIDLDEVYLKFSDALAVLMMLIALVGLILTVFTAVVFIRRRTTPLVMASSRELSACLLAGFLISYGLTFAFIAKPSAASCGIRRFGVGFPLSLCLGALLVKTNRISRVFNRQPRKGRPGYISPEWQIIFTSLLLLVQVLILVVWLLVEPPGSKIKVVDANEKIQLICSNSGSAGVGVSLFYNMVLLAFCTFYGVKTRKIPENFNEARYISFSMYTVAAVWLAFIPAYLATGTEYEAAMLALPLLLSMTALLGFLFLPKLYIIIWEPERNVRNATRRPSRPADRSRAAQSSQSDPRERTSNPSSNQRSMEMQAKERTSANVNGAQSQNST